MGNLLAYSHCFSWDSTIVDRGDWIEDLNEALNAAQKEKDRIFRAANFYDTSRPWACFFDFFWSTYTDFEAFRRDFTWITQSQYQVLVNILQIIQTPTPGNALDYDMLDREFAGENNSLLGVYDVLCPQPLVFDYTSWLRFHGDFARQMTFDRRCDKYEYFIRFFRPDPIDVNQVNKIIQKGNAPSSLERMDPAKNYGDKAHMHLKYAKKQGALNIDGSWRHNKSDIMIPRRDREYLSELGFVLPREWYV